MAYVPVSVNVYCAAYSGMMGALAAARQTTDNVATDYDHDTKVSGAFAAALDTALNDSTPNVLQLGEIESIISELFYTAFPTGSGSESKTAPNYVALAGAVVARLTQADAFVAGEGIVPPGVPNNPEINVAQVRYVTKGGNDATGDGSLGAPYLTVAAAMASITDADPVTKPYAVQVGPGVYATGFTIKNGVYVIGWGSGPGNFNGGPLEAVTILAPTAAQCLDNASFAGAGNKAAGIMNCGLSTALVVSFLAAATTGNATFFLQNVITDLAVTFIGAGTGADYARIDNLYSNSGAASPITFTNMGGAAIDNVFNDFLSSDIVINQSAAIQSFFEIFNTFSKTLVLNWTSALIANFMNVLTYNSFSLSTTITGGGALLTGEFIRELTATDAAQRLRFTNDATATLIGTCGGTTIVSMTPTAARSIFILPTQANVGGLTRVIIKNLSPTFPIDFSFSSSSPVAGSPTYVQPLGQVELICPTKVGAGFSPWYVVPYVQSGKVTLVNGVSALVPTDVTAQAAIVTSLDTWNGAIGSPQMKPGDRVVGTRVGGGGFKVTSVDPATGLVVATDQGTYDWCVKN